MTHVRLATRGLGVDIGGKTICRDLTLEFDAGECWAVLGMNGAGKTTLLHTLAGVRRAGAGEVLLEGVPIQNQPRRQIAQKLALLTQDPSDAFDTTVLEGALIGRHPHLPKWWQWEGEKDEEIAMAAINAVDLEGYAARRVSSLSGGERERLAIAALLSQQTVIQLLDEPTSHLDTHHQIAMLQLFSAQAAKTGTVIMSLHDASLAARYCTHALLLSGDGAVSAGPVSEVLSAQSLSALYRHPMREFNSDGLRLFVPG